MHFLEKLQPFTNDIQIENRITGLTVKRNRKK